MKAELPRRWRQEVALHGARMAGTFREQVQLLFEGRRGYKFCEHLEEQAKVVRDTPQAIRFLDLQGGIAIQLVACLADVLDRYKRDIDARLTKLERERL